MTTITQHDLTGVLWESAAPLTNQEVCDHFKATPRCYDIKTPDNHYTRECWQDNMYEAKS